MNTTIRKKKRFIAGATCPECKAVDTMMLFQENNVEKVECVQCHYQMVQPEQQVAKQARPAEQVIGVFKPE
ncbi:MULTISPECIES: YheV family putative zinc ribbon protein [Rheinheimera]|uniref:YheV family putative zinc ribbon protein n=1 Tax=Rheinheimera marina TaxID=1774958 RepID=A0ABV9JHP4_9GAMM